MANPQCPRNIRDAFSKHGFYLDHHQSLLVSLKAQSSFRSIRRLQTSTESTSVYYPRIRRLISCNASAIVQRGFFRRVLTLLCNAIIQRTRRSRLRRSGGCVSKYSLYLDRHNLHGRIGPRLSRNRAIFSMSSAVGCSGYVMDTL